MWQVSLYRVSIQAEQTWEKTKQQQRAGTDRRTRLPLSLSSLSCTTLGEITHSLLILYCILFPSSALSLSLSLSFSRTASAFLPLRLLLQPTCFRQSSNFHLFFYS